MPSSAILVPARNFIGIEHNANVPNFIENWCECADSPVAGGHTLHVLSERVGGRAASRNSLIQAMATHYENPKAFADRIKRRG